MPIKRCYLFALLAFLLISSLRAAPVVVQDPAQSYNLFQASTLLETKAGSLSVKALLQNPDRYQFVPTQHGLIKPYYRQFEYWFRFELTNQTASDLFLHFVYAGTEYITVYEVNDGKLLETYQLGTLQPQRTYTYLKSNEVCPTSVRQGQTHVFYVQMRGVFTTALPIYAQATGTLLQTLHRDDLFYGLYYGFILIIIIYSLLLYARLRENDTLLYSIWVIFMGLQLALFRGHTNEFFWPSNPAIERYATVLAGLTGLVHIPFTLAFLRLRQRAPLFYKLGIGILILYAIGIVLNLIGVSASVGESRRLDFVPQIALLEGIFSVTAGIIIFRRGFRPALFYVIGNLVFFASIFLFLAYANGALPYSFWTYNSLHLGSGIEIILFTLALTNKVNLLKQQQEAAVQEQLRLTEANRQLVAQQNTILEEKVSRRTAELHSQKEELQKTLTTLQATQTQLIQQAKLASLGEVTAGIAHEILNPLNFVNNFAKMSVELADELQEGVETNDYPLVTDLTGDIRKNLQSIAQNGQRAADIVGNMLEHARTGTSGPRQPTDLNALADRYIHLSYHALLAKDKSGSMAQLNAQLITELDPKVGMIDLVPQDMGRVLQNLFNNAFYEVAQKARKQPADYQPTVCVRTERKANEVKLTVYDNGAGIPVSIRPKIFQPFFTTKPTGQGIGLGLSLSYDIVTNGYGGRIDVHTEEGNFTEFHVYLPLSSSGS
jgi:two-component system NtrC family sensor kinase